MSFVISPVELQVRANVELAIKGDADETGMSDLLNKTFYPFSTTKLIKSTSTITLMWTHTAEEDTVREIDYGMWVQNHLFH
ncbi:unnamed protein product [Didymodactylos carnosus]|uniref:Uncharacterized protein n=1 Tax=Didymodactylos carnosus TaxID=1234261 RepID=A0A8S2DGJ0_9BILA|nr:unnamed protein product [Didymodactylos carnosus]CAF3673364.1 unnamed protein product [Didymodactylos carnosus]